MCTTLVPNAVLKDLFAMIISSLSNWVFFTAIKHGRDENNGLLYGRETDRKEIEKWQTGV